MLLLSKYIIVLEFFKSDWHETELYLFNYNSIKDLQFFNGFFPRIIFQKIGGFHDFSDLLLIPAKNLDCKNTLFRLSEYLKRPNRRVYLNIFL